MNIQRFKRMALGVALLGATTSVALGTVPAARADSLGPTIQGIADSISYGTIAIDGGGFAGRDAVTLQILNPTGSAVLLTHATRSDRLGEVHSIFAISVPCALQAAQQLTIRAVDSVTNEVSNTATVFIGSQLTGPQTQLTAAQSALAYLEAYPPYYTVDWSSYYAEIAARQADVAADQARLAAAQIAYQQARAACAANGS